MRRAGPSSTVYDSDPRVRRPRKCRCRSSGNKNGERRGCAWPWHFLGDRKSVSLDELLKETHESLRRIENLIVESVAANIEQKVSGTWPGTDDALFAPLTAFVKPACDLQWHWRAIRLWLVEIAPLVEDAEGRLGKRFHKGAPIYNTGLSFFMAGDLARAMQYIAAAAEEDTATYGGASKLLEGEGLAETVLLGTHYGWLTAEYGTDYAAATGQPLSEDEIRGLVRFLGQRQADAVLFIAGMHRYSSQVIGPDNVASRLQRVRAFADLLVVFESSLRRWQLISGQLHDRSRDLLRPNAVALAEFDNRKNAYAGVPPDVTTNVDAMVRQELARFDAVGQVPEKAAVAVYVSYRLRNSVMHVLDDQLELFEKPELLHRVFGFALVALRLSQCGDERAIAGL